jgi:hypothetical protein
MATPKTTEPATDADARWLEIIRQHVRSLQYGVVQIVVHDGRVTQIERTERVRLEKQAYNYEI